MKNKNNNELKAYYNKTRNNWFVPFPIRDINTNEIKIHKKCFSSLEEANEEIEQFQYRSANKIYIENNGIPIYKLMEYINERKFKNGQIQSGRYGDAKEMITKIAKTDIGKEDISKITSEDLENYFLTLRSYSKSYMDKWISQFIQAFRYAERQHLIFHNPMYNVTIPKSEKKVREVRALELKEQKVLTDYLMNKSIKEEPLKNVFLMQMYMGLRIGETLALKKEDFNFDEDMLHIKRTLKVDNDKQIYVGNTTKSPAGIREIPIPDKIKESLEDQLKSFKENKYDLLFINERGRIVNPRNANSILKRIVLHTLRTDDISTHSLRHTFGTRCIEAGISPVAVQKLMGHEDLSVTMNTYVSVLNKFKTDELKKLNSFYNKEAVFGNKKVSSKLEI